MRVSDTASEDSSTLDCQDLNTVDESEAYGLLASLGKRYYKSVGMGTSLDIEKLRLLHGRHRRIILLYYYFKAFFPFYSIHLDEQRSSI